MKDIQKKVNELFEETFGFTPLTERTQDILKQTYDLTRFTDLKNLKTKTGDLLCSVIQLCNESGWNIDEVINNTLVKIETRKLQYKSLGRKKNIAIYGGAFNPIHSGHIQVAKFILTTSSHFDEVWLMPCYQSIFGKELVSAEHRLRMCELAVKEDARIKVFDYEIKHKLGGETYKLAKQLKSDPMYDIFDFYYVIGQDNANSFDKWVNYEHLEKIAKFVVVPRLGFEKDPNVNWYLNKPHIYLNNENFNIPEMSSTKIRTIIHFDNAKDELSEYMNENVIDYIIENKLYK